MKLVIRITQCDCGGYRAQCPALPGCFARGRSPQEAREKIEEAIVGYLASLDLAVRDEQPELLTA